MALNAAFRLQRVQQLPISLTEAWEFFSNPRNLALITPPNLGLRLTSDVPTKMYEGVIITYRVSPVLNIPMTWVSEISQIREPSFFVDRQLVGPYRLWHHQHLFREIKGGVEAEDIVHYSLPLPWFLGKALDRLLVRKQLRGIFDFRQKALIERFGEFTY